MARSRSDWEGIFTTWSQGPAATEATKAENAEKAIRKAIDASKRLQARQVDVFPQGSYRNRTNVRQDSDVDICIRLKSTFHYELPDTATIQEAGFTEASYTYSEFKNDVQEALVDYFGGSTVTRGNKAFDVHANTYRIDADVVPTFEYRWYQRDSSGRLFYTSGTQLIPDSGGKIENYPDQHYARGVEKNDRTNRAFKRTVRILKRLRNEMAAAGNAEAKATPSYLIECLVGSVEETCFIYPNWWQVVREVMAQIFNGTLNDDDCKHWLEVNRIKFLFFYLQPWQRKTAHDFASAAWDYVGFE
jgi:predicted nucleotidyltransferase